MKFSLNSLIIKPEKNISITSAIILLHGYGGDWQRYKYVNFKLEKIFT